LAYKFVIHFKFLFAGFFEFCVAKILTYAANLLMQMNESYKLPLNNKTWYCRIWQ